MDHRAVQRQLEQLGVAIGAAEAHGCLCGALSARVDYPAGEWLGELCGGSAGAGPELPVLQQLYQDTRAALCDRDPAFAPLLPDDATALDQRVAALAAWCSGFLYGFGTSRAGQRAPAGDDTAEVLRDFAEIARAGLPADTPAEDGERAWAELHEFVRTGAQLAFEAQPAPRSAPAGTPAGRH